MRTRCVVVEVEMHVEGEVISGVCDGGEDFGVGFAVFASGVEPSVGAGEAVSRDENELLGSCFADGGDHGLVVCEDEFGGHGVWLVHDAEDYVGIGEEAGRKGGPEGGELGGCGSVGVTSVANYGTGGGLHARIVVAWMYVS